MLEAIREMGLEGTYVDIGAHVGNHSVYFATRCKAAHVIAVEPNPENLVLLRENTSGLPVTVEAFAVGYSAGYIEVDGMKGRVSASRLSTFLPPTTVFVKMDIEGWETPALEGSLDAIERVKPAGFAIENHGGVESVTHKRQVALLEPLGYRLVGVYNHTPTMLWRLR